MQCPNCRFQNMPGSSACGRCGTSLGLATAVLDVQPPRAGRVKKHLRRAIPVRKAARATRDLVGHVEEAFTRRAIHSPALPILVRLVVPGWAHFYSGQRPRGFLFLLAYLGLLVPGLLLLGTNVGITFLGLAFSVHTSSAIDVISHSFSENTIRRRMGWSIVVSFILFLTLYLPAGWLISHAANPRRLTFTAGESLKAGDVVLVNDWATPKVGDVVLYQLPDHIVRTGAGRFVGFTGERVDRILAESGDQVRWESGRLTVNKSPSAWLPLAPHRLRGSERFVVPADHVLILPSTSPGVPENADASWTSADWHTLCLVPRASVRGKAYMRWQPLSRFGRIH